MVPSSSGEDEGAGDKVENETAALGTDVPAPELSSIANEAVVSVAGRTTKSLSADT